MAILVIMQDPVGHPPERLDDAAQILIVVGAHPHAERHDRPLAYALRERILALLALPSREGESTGTVPDVLVCCDLWYLNDESLKDAPTISIGAPGVNALAAFLASRLPSAYVVDDVLMVQLDPEMHTPIVSCWGTTPYATARAIDVFLDKYGQSFVDAL